MQSTFIRVRLLLRRHYSIQVALMVATEDIKLSPDVKELAEATLETYCQHSDPEDRDKCYERVEQFRKRVCWLFCLVPI